ncbi:helix-turn-helix domain-containing protein [Bacillus sp. FJAT-45066]|uniref:helix-turn-helix domain-containing protein n=1 Tax=Bacillus sp. FJAT-45066 TaxID=2011010 RepID=UPI000BB9310E|nr:helix-turn-helix domain-containing protein [Bacillus sp. FJAT-45066]
MEKKPSVNLSGKVKIEAVEKVLNGMSVRVVADEFNVTRQTVNRWVNTYKHSGPIAFKVATNKHVNSFDSVNLDDKKRIQQLEKLLKEKEMENEILKKFQTFLKEKK